MALTNLQRYQLTQDADLRNRVAAEIAKQAQYVCAGGVGITNFQVHSRARVAAANPGSEVDQFMWALVFNTEEAVAAQITDAAIFAVVNSTYAAIWGG